MTMTQKKKCKEDKKNIKVQVRDLKLHKETLKDLSAGDKAKAVKGGMQTVRNCY